MLLLKSMLDITRLMIWPLEFCRFTQWLDFLRLPFVGARTIPRVKIHQMKSSERYLYLLFDKILVLFIACRRRWAKIPWNELYPHFNLLLYFYKNSVIYFTNSCLLLGSWSCSGTFDQNWQWCCHLWRRPRVETIICDVSCCPTPCWIYY